MKIKFDRGYKEVRAKIDKNAKYNRECKNCQSFFKDKGDDCELCQNPSVLEYDICTEGSRTWCCYWESMNKRCRK